MCILISTYIMLTECLFIFMCIYHTLLCLYTNIHCRMRTFVYLDSTNFIFLFAHSTITYYNIIYALLYYRWYGLCKRYASREAL